MVRCEVVISCVKDCCLPCLLLCVWSANERARGTPSCGGWKKQDVEFCWSHTAADAVRAEFLADSERFEKHYGRGACMPCVDEGLTLFGYCNMTWCS